MYRGRWKLRRANVRHISGAEKIYINENLTAQKAALFKKVRDKKKCGKDGKCGQPMEKFSLNRIQFLMPSRINTDKDLNKL